MSEAPITRADLILLKVAIVFANSESERAHAQREFDLTARLLKFDAPKASHRPRDIDAKKKAARRFLALIDQNREKVRPSGRDKRVGGFACDASGIMTNVSNAFDTIAEGLDALIEDRHLDAIPFDEPGVLEAVDLVRQNRRRVVRRSSK